MSYPVCGGGQVASAFSPGSALAHTASALLVQNCSSVYI